MENNAINPSDTVPEAVDVAVAGGKENDASVSADTLSLSEIQQITGRKYSSVEDARKGLRETYNFVGKKASVQTPADLSQFASKDEIAQLREENWYARHPEHEAHRELISALALKTGKPLDEVVTLDPYKQVFEKSKGYDEIQSAKSVLESNPRLASTRNNIDTARGLMKESAESFAKGDTISAQTAYRTAIDKAVGSVIDAYELGK